MAFEIAKRILLKFKKNDTEKFLGSCKKNDVKSYEFQDANKHVKLKFHGKCRHREKGVTNKNINKTKIVKKGR